MRIVRVEFDLPYTIEINEAIEVIEAKRQKDIDNTLKTYNEDPDFKIVIGRWRRPYLKAGKKNIPLDKDVDIEKLTFEDVQKMAEEYSPRGRKKK